MLDLRPSKRATERCSIQAESWESGNVRLPLVIYKEKKFSFLRIADPPNGQDGVRNNVSHRLRDGGVHRCCCR